MQAQNRIIFKIILNINILLYIYDTDMIISVIAKVYPNLSNLFKKRKAKRYNIFSDIFHALIVFLSEEPQQRQKR